MHHADLVVCVGARFDDRVTGKLAEFCPQARKIHIDIDPGSIDKVVTVDVRAGGRLRRRCWRRCYGLPALQALPPSELAPWWAAHRALARRATAWPSAATATPSCRSS